MAMLCGTFKGDDDLKLVPRLLLKRNIAKSNYGRNGARERLQTRVHTRAEKIRDQSGLCVGQGRKKKGTFSSRQQKLNALERKRGE